MILYKHWLANKINQKVKLTFYVFPNEWIFHDVLSISFQNFLKIINIVILICTEKETFTQSLDKRTPFNNKI